MLDLPQYLTPRERPSRSPAMYHEWRDLLFLHFSTEPDLVQALLPPGLTVDIYPDGTGAERAWVGLVPFRMQGVRLRGLPPVPGTDAFPETNVRTYVHREGREPGVWFFSLDAASALACRAARALFSLPYFHASMRCDREGDDVTYASERLEEPKAALALAYEIGEDLGRAEPGTLDFFLIERYLLYSYKKGALLTGQVHHMPYPLRAARVLRCEESLIRAAGMAARSWEHVCFSAGVDVEVFALVPTS